MSRRHKYEFEYQGRTWTTADIALKTGLHPHSVRTRIQKGWSIEEIMQPKIENGDWFSRKAAEEQGAPPPKPARRGYSAMRAAESHQRQVEINRKAREMGMTYGQYQKMLYMQRLKDEH